MVSGDELQYVVYLMLDFFILAIPWFFKSGQFLATGQTDILVHVQPSSDSELP